jgi:hypothetical protein
MMVAAPGSRRSHVKSPDSPGKTRSARFLFMGSAASPSWNKMMSFLPVEPRIAGNWNLTYTRF